MKYLSLLILPNLLFAAEFLQPKWVGSGCPNIEPLSVVRAPGASAISILFNKLEASNLPGGNGRSRTKCIVSIPVNLSANEQVIVENVTYRGFYEVSDGSSLTLSSSFFFENGIAVTRDARGRLQYLPGPALVGGMYKRLSDSGAKDFSWGATIKGLTHATKCGESGILHIVSTVTLDNNGPAAATMDSADLATPSQAYRFNVVRCSYPGKVVNYPRYLLDRILNPSDEY